MSPKSDTNPLTRLVHMYYIHPRLARHTPKPKEEPKTQGEAQPRPHEDSTSKPIPKGGPHAAPRLKQTPPSPHTKGPGSPSPNQPGDGGSTDYTRQAPSNDAPADSTLPITGCVCPGPLRAGFPGRSTDPRFSKALVPCLSRRPSHPSTRRMHRDAGYESPPQAACSPSAVRSCAADGVNTPHTTLTTAENMWG